MKDLQASFFKANVCHIDTPQDHAYIATLYNFAAQNRTNSTIFRGSYEVVCASSGVLTQSFMLY